MRDYPQAIAETNRVEPAPRRVRGVLAGEVVFDTSRALVRVGIGEVPAVLHPARRRERRAPRRRGAPAAAEPRHGPPARTARRRRGAPGRRPPLFRDSLDGLAGTMRFDWDALDAWFEEDEEVFVHPRNPYARVDALRSARPVRIELDGAVLAASDSPVHGLRDRASDALLLQPHATWTSSTRGHGHRHRLPLQGHGRATTGRSGSTTALHEDLAWSYAFPTREILPIAGLDRLLQREGRRLSRRRAARTADHALRQVRTGSAAERV